MANTFQYLSYDVDDDKRTVDFNYEINNSGHTYPITERLVFPYELGENTNVNGALRALHVALGISYYKTFLPPVIIHPYEMSDDEAAFWNDVFCNGLGEFLYVNKLSKDKVAKFIKQPGKTSQLSDNAELTDKAIIGIGGGKDSIVAGELLKQVGLDLQGFVMATGEQLGQSKAVADVMQIPLNAVARTLDPQLMNLQMQPGAYRGHVPISLIFGLVGVVLALSQKAKYIVVANETSSSTPTAKWQGEEVNHQWSKSFGFEQKLQNYIKELIHPGLTYFSAIRPYTSIAVAKRFARYPQYFEVFTSDNYVFRIDPSKRPNGRWSLESPKSLSSYILLAPWLSDDDMERTFTQNFLDQKSLEPLFIKLTGLAGHPPLDCVGTVEEIVLSLNLLAKQDRYSDSHLMKVAKDKKLITASDWQAETDKLLSVQPCHAFPNEISDIILAELQK